MYEVTLVEAIDGCAPGNGIDSTHVLTDIRCTEMWACIYLAAVTAFIVVISWLRMPCNE